MVQLFSSTPKKGQKDETIGDTALHTGLTPLEGQGFSSQRIPSGQSSSQKISDNDRCITDRVGSHLGGQVRKWNMGPPFVIRTHKCAQTEGCTFGSQGSAAVFTPQTCASKNRQYLRSLLRKSPGWDEINTLPPSGNRSADMGMATPVYIPGVANRATKILARVGPLPGESRLHTVVVAQI